MNVRPLAAVRVVWFDVGETLVDETRAWGAWADALGVPRLTLFALLGAVIARGGHHREVFEIVAPGLDVDATGRRLAIPTVERQDFYPDAFGCLRDLRTRGVRVGVCGNQPHEVEAALRSMAVPLDFLGSSAGWGVAKPSPAFFHRVIAESGVAPHEIAYVGDRLDNDVLPAIEAGIVGVLLRRGPWGHLHARGPEASRAHLVLESLSELPGHVGR